MRTVAAYAGTLRQQGLSLREIASHIEAYSFKTRQSGPWSAVQVKRILDRQKPIILNSVHEFDNG
ncbi:recombinase family protein [Deinococcus alpinitundrae]|uniref:recombinase family protein n=1 Tax=Deinococcus alpinitundrae TaxID=468913 RepID=UPI00137AB558|nr:recombinase family protein [Deinococcus alpinitundrae]